MFCQIRWASGASGSGAAAFQVRTTLAQAFGISASTARRARTSSLRLVSWVDRDVMPSGAVAWRAAHSAWNSATDIPNRVGSPPTSLSATIRAHW